MRKSQTIKPPKRGLALPVVATIIVLLMVIWPEAAHAASQDSYGVGIIPDSVTNRCRDFTNLMEDPTKLSVFDLTCVGEALIALFALVLPGFVAVGMILMSGFYYITSDGDPQKIKKAADTFMWALVGLGIVLIAALIIRFTGFLIGVDYGV